MRLLSSTSGFTLIELVIGMTVFSIGLTGIYMLLSTTLSDARSSRDEIIVSGLLDEQMELVMNLRDTNLRNYIPWDALRVEPPATQTGFASGVYLIENDFTSSGIVLDPMSGIIQRHSVKISKIDPIPLTLPDLWSKAQLRLDTQGRYVHSESTGTGTSFASYLRVSPLMVGPDEVKKDGKNQGWVIDARVIVKNGERYSEYDAKTMITDWQK